MHIQRTHKELWTKFLELENDSIEANSHKRKSTQPTASRASKQPRNDDDNNDHVMNLCVEEIVCHGRPFSLFNDPPMRKIIELARNTQQSTSSLAINVTNLKKEVELKATEERKA